MGILKKIFQTVLLFQIILFGIWMVENIDNLDVIPINYSINNEDKILYVNFYEVLIVIGIVFALVIIGGLVVFNSEGTRNIGKYVGIGAFYVILNIAFSSYILLFGGVGYIIEIIIGGVYLMGIFDSIQGNEGGQDR